MYRILASLVLLSAVWVTSGCSPGATTDDATQAAIMRANQERDAANRKAEADKAVRIAIGKAYLAVQRACRNCEQLGEKGRTEHQLGRWAAWFF